MRKAERDLQNCLQQLQEFIDQVLSVYFNMEEMREHRGYITVKTTQFQILVNEYDIIRGTINMLQANSNSLYRFEGLEELEGLIVDIYIHRLPEYWKDELPF